VFEAKRLRPENGNGVAEYVYGLSIDA
jgi:hypothetical protein